MQIVEGMVFRNTINGYESVVESSTKAFVTMRVVKKGSGPLAVGCLWMSTIGRLQLACANGARVLVPQAPATTPEPSPSPEVCQYAQRVPLEIQDKHTLGPRYWSKGNRAYIEVMKEVGQEMITQVRRERHLREPMPWCHFQNTHVNLEWWAEGRKGSKIYVGYYCPGCGGKQ